MRDRDGWTVETGFDQYVTFNRKRSYVNLSYSYEGSRNDGSDWEFDGHHLGLGLHTPLWGGVVLDVHGAYTRRDYLHVNSFDANPLGVLNMEDRDERQDDRLKGSVALTRALGRSFEASFRFEHISNLSNIAFFDYRRNIWTLGLTGRF